MQTNAIPPPAPGDCAPTSEEPALTNQHAKLHQATPMTEISPESKALPKALVKDEEEGVTHAAGKEEQPELRKYKRLAVFLTSVALVSILAIAGLTTALVTKAFGTHTQKHTYAVSLTSQFDSAGESVVAKVHCVEVLEAIVSVQNGDADQGLVMIPLGNGEFSTPSMSAAHYQVLVHKDSFGMEQVFLSGDRDVSYDVSCETSMAACETNPSLLCNVSPSAATSSSSRALSFEDSFDGDARRLAHHYGPGGMNGIKGQEMCDDILANHGCKDYCPPAAAVFMNKASLQTAVQAYNANPTAAIATYGPIAAWDVSAITDMSYLFVSLKNFNADISNWDTSGVTTMKGMFVGASAFNQALSFDTSKVTEMQYMFSGASAFNQALSFDTSKVTNMNRMFVSAHKFNQPLSFDTSKVTNMWGMFFSASAFNQPLSFDTSKVTDMGYMFYGSSGWLIDPSPPPPSPPPPSPDGGGGEGGGGDGGGGDGGGGDGDGDGGGDEGY